MISEDELYETANMSLLDDNDYFKGKSVKEPETKAKFRAWRGFQNGSLVVEYGKYEGSDVFTTRTYDPHRVMEEVTFTSESDAEDHFINVMHLIQNIYRDLLNLNRQTP